MCRQRTFENLYIYLLNKPLQSLSLDVALRQNNGDNKLIVNQLDC